MADDKNELGFKDCRLLSVHFEVNKSFVAGKDVQLNIRLNLTHEYRDAENLMALTMGVEAKGENAPITINVSMGGLFQFHHKPETDIELARIAEVNCAAILFPFVREAVADIIRRAGLPPLLLDPINFIEFYNSNHKDSPINK